MQHSATIRWELYFRILLYFWQLSTVMAGYYLFEIGWQNRSEHPSFHWWKVYEFSEFVVKLMSGFPPFGAPASDNQSFHHWWNLIKYIPPTEISELPPLWIIYSSWVEESSHHYISYHWRGLPAINWQTNGLCQLSSGLSYRTEWIRAFDIIYQSSRHYGSYTCQLL